jgi:hypothetical protein
MQKDYICFYFARRKREEKKGRNGRARPQAVPLQTEAMEVDRGTILVIHPQGEAGGPDDPYLRKHDNLTSCRNIDISRVSSDSLMRANHQY